MCLPMAMVVRHPFRTLALAMLMSIMASAACADTAVGTAQIVNGDIPSARQSALKDALWNAGMESDISVATRSASIGSQHQDVILVSQQEQIGQLKIDSESIEDGRLTLHISFTRKAAGVKQTCAEESFGLGNVKIDWLFPRQISHTLRNTDAQALLRMRLEQLLHGDARDWLANAGAATPVFRLALSLLTQDGGWFGKESHSLHYDVLGPEDMVIASGDISLGKGDISRRAKYELGYANLSRLELSPATEAALSQASKAISAVLRCLPAVARIVLDSDGKASVRLGKFAGSVQDNSLLFFSPAFPIKAGGAIDMAAISGNMRVDNTQAGLTTLKLLPGAGVKPQTGLTGYVTFY